MYFLSITSRIRCQFYWWKYEFSRVGIFHFTFFDLSFLAQFSVYVFLGWDFFGIMVSRLVRRTWLELNWPSNSWGLTSFSADDHRLWSCCKSMEVSPPPPPGVSGSGIQTGFLTSTERLKCDLIFLTVDATERRETPFLFRSSQELPRLRLGPTKGFLSWHGALLGPSTRLVRCFRNYRDTRTPSGVPR